MSTQSDNQVTVYEEPVHERIRKFLRIETLFNRINYLKTKETHYENYFAAVSLAELYELLLRMDIKAELIRDLETQNSSLKRFKDQPDADSKKLNSMLEKQENHLNHLYSKDSSYLDHLKQDELFKTLVKYSRSSTHPSSLTYWLSRDDLSRENQINLWLEPINFINKSITFLLTTIRKSATAVDKLAKDGFYTDKFDSQKNLLLIRVTLTSDHFYFPSISVGKQRITIRFMIKDDKNKFIAHKYDVPFILSTCIM
ncbi:MAG: cell division protein ZapD [Pseudomonadota bacterium]|nr:cell division protein ZapD [Pseudomonadota bacterium]